MKKTLKRLSSVVMSFVMMCSLLSVLPENLNPVNTMTAEAASAQMEKAIQWAINIANDDSHGYSQANRNGPDYDCSSLVGAALEYAGFSGTRGFNTRNMGDILKKIGFTYISGTSNLQRGDILWREGHTEIYIGNNQTVGAHQNYNHPEPGDQTGKEISVSAIYGSWSGVYRHNASSSYNFPGEEDSSYSVPISVTASKKINTYDGSGNIESNRWIDPGDACAIDKVYKNGFVHVGYPASSGTRWAYAKKDDFNINPAPSSYSPRGNVEYASGGAGTITIKGWAQDQDDTSRPVEIHVYKDSLSPGNGLASGIIANRDRGDGTHTGFEASFSVGNAGTYHILVFALNLSNTGGNDWTIIGDMNVVVPASGEIVNLGDNFDASIKSVQSSKYIITNKSSSNVFIYENPVGYTERYWNFARQSDGSYRIKAYCNDRYMDVDGAIDEDGRNVQSWPDNGGGSAQRWFILRCGNNYVLRPACSTARVLDVYGGETKDGANLAISEYHGGANQQVIIEKTLRANVVNLGDNFDAMIQNTASGKFVIASAENNNVCLYDTSGSSYPSQRVWNFARQADNSYRITSYFNSKCLDVNGGQDTNSNVGTYPPNDSNAQKWYIVKNGSNYRLMSACSNTRSLDIAGGDKNTANGTNIQIFDNNDTNAQSFSINKVSGDTTKPTISKVEISNVTANGYKVKITASDNIGIKEVKVPTWTKEGSNNGQDDLKWHVATQTSQNTWEYNVKVSEHNNERGVYCTHVYVYDFSGNWNMNVLSDTKVGLFNLTYDPNGGTAGSESGKRVTGATTCTKNQLIYSGSNFVSMTWSKPSREGYTFTGWYTAKTGGTKIHGADGKCVNDGKYFKNNVYVYAGDLTIYAQWTPTKTSYNFTVDPNGGTMKDKDWKNDTTKAVTYDKKLEYNGSIWYSATSCIPKRTGYTFTGFYTAATGGIKIYGADGKCVNEGTYFKDNKYINIVDLKVYAQWKANAYKVTFDANGGTCDKASIDVTYDGKYGTLPTPKKTGYTFNGWYTAKTGSTKITSDSKVAITANQTLYAQWKKDEPAVTTVTTKTTAKATTKTTTSTTKATTRDTIRVVTRKTTTAQTTGEQTTTTVNVQEKPICDLNGDNKTSLTDIVILQKFLSKIVTFDKSDFKEADLNNDGKVNVFDMIILKRALFNQNIQNVNSVSKNSE